MQLAAADLKLHPSSLPTLFDHIISQLTRDSSLIRLAADTLVEGFIVIAKLICAVVIALSVGDINAPLG